jgi:hypothetical protein
MTRFQSEDPNNKSSFHSKATKEGLEILAEEIELAIKSTIHKLGELTHSDPLNKYLFKKAHRSPTSVLTVPIPMSSV